MFNLRKGYSCLWSCVCVWSVVYKNLSDRVIDEDWSCPHLEWINECIVHWML